MEELSRVISNSLNSKREELSSIGSKGCAQTKDNLNTVPICEGKDDDSEAWSNLKPTSEE